MGPDGPAPSGRSAGVRGIAVRDDQDMAMAPPNILPGSPAEIAASRDVAGSPRRARGAALIRDVILGGQDGLVNVLGLVLGMAVATGSPRVVITAGLAALLAESIAMAGVAYTATGAERQLGATMRGTLEAHRRTLGRERDVTRRRRLAREGLSDDVIALVGGEVDAEAAVWREHLEVMRTALAPVRETRPARAAAVVGISTALGSAVPLLPFVVLPFAIAPAVALGAGAIVLALAGVERARMTGGRPRRAAGEMVFIGLVSALAGYLIGQLLGAPLA
jgi:VIT1/CCC1 family predicted Fe2+/Mn2+ transporter